MYLLDCTYCIVDNALFDLFKTSFIKLEKHKFRINEIPRNTRKMILKFILWLIVLRLLSNRTFKWALFALFWQTCFETARDKDLQSCQLKAPDKPNLLKKFHFLRKNDFQLMAFFILLR